MNPTVNLYTKGREGKGSGRNEAEPTKEALLKPVLFLLAFSASRKSKCCFDHLRAMRH